MLPETPKKTKIMKLLSLVSSLFLAGAIPVLAQTYSFNTVTAVSSAADGALDGWVVPDHLRGNSYTSNIGQMGLIFADQSPLAGITGTPNGTFRGDSGGSLSNRLGLFAFCIDSESPFTATGASSTRTLDAYTVAEAESRYVGEVSFYLPGALKRAAYLLETFGQTAHNGGNVEAAAMQAAIWESLYDSTVSVTEGNGNYYIRTNVSDSTQRSQAIATRDLANSWLGTAAANNWGGSSYDPANRVLVWMDPTNANAFQSVITMNPLPMSITPIPEPGSAALLMTIGGLLAFRRRR